MSGTPQASGEVTKTPTKVDSVVHRRSGKLGALRIRQELQSKGLDSDKVQAALGQLKSTELARAREVWARKFDALPADAAQRGKQARFLAARGFDGEVVRRVLGRSPGEDSDPSC